MANVLIEENTMKAIGNAIRSKTGKSDLLLPADMPSEIDGIQSGDGGDNNEFSFSRDGYSVRSQIVTIGANTITNGTDMYNFLNELVDGYLVVYVLLSEISANNQVVGSRGDTISGYKRYRDGSIVSANLQPDWDAVLVEGTQYYLVSVVHN